MTMIDWSQDPEKRKKAMAFVEATQELIDTEGLENISIRKIAEKAGFHNSTIYLYFKDANQLILLASLKHFNAYSAKLAQYAAASGTPLEKFLAIWQAFGETVFRKPHIFRNFFFGKNSHQLTPIIVQYYQLFPEERASYTQEIRDMYYGGNIYDRCLQILKPLIREEATCITEENVDTVNSIIVACLKQLLDTVCADPDPDPAAVNDRMMQMIRHVIGLR